MGEELRASIGAGLATGAVVYFIDRRASVSLRRLGTALRHRAAPLVLGGLLLSCAAKLLAIHLPMMSMVAPMLRALACAPYAVATTAAAAVAFWLLLPRRRLADCIVAARDSSANRKPHAPAPLPAALGSERDTAMAARLLAVARGRAPLNCVALVHAGGDDCVFRLEAGGAGGGNPELADGVVAIVGADHAAGIVAAWARLSR